MQNFRKFYIDGEWRDPVTACTRDIVNPFTEQPFATISMGSADDVDHAVEAARAAFLSFSLWSIEERVQLLERIIAAYEIRVDEIAQVITQEMGSPIFSSRRYQAPLGIEHFRSALKALTEFEFERVQDSVILRYEPIGVCGLITPWNWPANQISAKVAPALAAGCAVILKPSELAPLDAIIFAEVLHEAGVPPGVFNLVNGDGVGVGEAMSAHEGIDMMSFTGSTRGGIAVAKSSADSVKRVTQELGGKSANLILDDADIAQAVADGITHVMDNSGQSCNAPTRMLVPQEFMGIAMSAARETTATLVMGNPTDDETRLGPVISGLQFDRIQRLIQQGIDEGATLVAGGTGRPEHLPTGYFVKPTVFANVTESMTVAREEIFGPVVCLMGYEGEEHGIEMANNSEYGLAGYVSSGNIDHALQVAKRIRAGQVAINYVGGNTDTPFGGYKRSGNGREKGVWGLLENLELKAITGAFAH